MVHGWVDGYVCTRLCPTMCMGMQGYVHTKRVYIHVQMYVLCVKSSLWDLQSQRE